MKNTKLFLFLLLPFFLFSQEKEKRLALVIGNANYDKGELKNPVNDARLIASTLDSLDFDVILKENLSTKREMTAAIREFGSRRSAYDVAFVYYAGHGVQVDDENFLLPTKETFEEEFDVMDYGVSVQSIMRYLRAQTNQVNILILDACRDNPFESSWGNTRSLKGQGLAKIPPPTGSLIAFSTDSGQTAPDGDGENSVYSVSLANNMLLKETSIDQVFRNVRSEVFSKTGGAQRPVEATQLTGDTFYFTKRDYDYELKRILKMIEEENLNEAIFMLESIQKSDTNNLDIINLLLRAYSRAGSLVVSVSASNPQADIQWEKAYNLLNGYIPDTISEDLLQTEVTPSEKIANLYYRQSRLLFLSKVKPDWKQVFLNIKMATKYDPLNPYWNYYLATIYNEYYFEISNESRKSKAQIEFNLAIKKYIKKINVRPDDHSLYFYLGFCYYFTERNDLAFKNWRYALKLDPNNIHYSTFIGQKMIQEGKYEEAIIVYDKALDKCNDCADLYVNRAQAHFNLNNYDSAINDFSIAYNLSDSELSKNLRRHRGNAYYYKAINNDHSEKSRENLINSIIDFDSTINYILKDINLEISKVIFEDLFEDNLVDIPELSLTILGRAKASLELARAENYLDLDYSESLKSAQKDYRVLINNGIFGSDEEGDILDSFFKTYYLGGNFEDLVLNAKAIIDKNFNELSKENLGLIYSSIGMTYWTTNQNEKAIEFMKKALELNPTLENYSEYAVSLFQTGDYDNALIYFNKCVDESPNNTTYMNNRGEFYFQIGDYINAEKDFLKCLEIGENFDIDVMLSLLKISIKNNDYDMQLKYAHDIQESISLDALSNYWLYEVYYHQKRYVKAITYLSIALTIKKSSDVILVSYQNYENTIPEDNEIIDYSSIYFQRGNLFSDLGDDIEACKDYKTALSFIEESSQLSIELEKLILENCKK